MMIFRKPFRSLLTSCFVVVIAMSIGVSTFAQDTKATGKDASTSKTAAPSLEKYPVFNPKIKRLAPVAAPDPKKLDEAIRRGIDFLVKCQNKNGSWGSATKTKELNIYAPIPGAHYGFRAACTALAISAIIESEDKRPEVIRALKRGETWLMANLGKVRLSSEICSYNTWTHSYAIQALIRMHGQTKDKKRQKQIRKLIEGQIAKLVRYECLAGGWNYYNDEHPVTERPNGSTMSFVTATGLVALAEARDMGIDVPEKMIKTSMESIRRQRYPDFCYAYGEYIKMAASRGINRPPGSAGRNQACNVAMYLWKDEKTTLPVMRTWLAQLYALDGWLSIGRKKPRPHESFAQVSGYFYYYGYYYAALCIDQLEPGERDYYRNHMAKILLPLQEKDGSWWDYILYDYHQQYGTALAVMSLIRCKAEK